MNNVLDFIRAAAPWVAVGLAVAIIAVRSAPTGTVRIWEYSEICRVRIPSVSFADSVPTPFGPTGHFPLSGGIDPLCPRGAFCFCAYFRLSRQDCAGFAAGEAAVQDGGAARDEDGVDTGRELGGVGIRRAGCAAQGAFQPCAVNTGAAVLRRTADRRPLR